MGYVLMFSEDVNGIPEVHILLLINNVLGLRNLYIYFTMIGKNLISTFKVMLRVRMGIKL